MADDHATHRKVKFDFEEDFSNGGGLQGQDFKLDIEGEDISEEESKNVRRPLLVVDGSSHQFWSYSSRRRIQSWGPSPSSRPFGARSRIA